MEKRKKQIVKKLLNQELDENNEKEIIDLIINQPITVDIDKMEDANLTFGDKMADKVSEIAGSWGFILCFMFFLLLWIVTNGIFLVSNASDPYPFILLNLILSCIAALQAPIIMMSQNRQQKKDSLRNQHDYYTDLKSELILEQIYEHVENIQKNQKRILEIIYKDDEKKDE